MQLSKGVGDWSAVITPIAEGFMNGEVEWFVPGVPVPQTDFSQTPTAPAETVIATTPARIQHLREPRDAGNAYQWSEYRRVRCQIPAANLGLPIIKGVRGRITNGGKDPNLTGAIIVVEDARNSSWAALRTIEGLLESAPPRSGRGDLECLR